MSLTAANAINEIAASLGNSNSRTQLDKASLANAVAGQFFSLWTAAGLPGTGVAPTAAVVPTHATLGAFGFTQTVPPVDNYYAYQNLATGNSLTNVELHDRIAHMAGLSGIVTTAQGALSLVTTNPGADRIGEANYSDVMWWLEVYSAMGATGVNATVNVTYDDDSTGNLAVLALGATPRQGRMYQLIPAVAGRFIKAVNNVTLSATTGTAGNFGITATRQRVSVSCAVAQKTELFDWAGLGIPKIPNNSCLFPIVLCSTTSTGTVRGQGKIIHV